MDPIKVIVEKHADGYVAYPLGCKGVVVGEGESYEAALADVTSAIRFHVETFGPDVFDGEPQVLEAFVAEIKASTRRTICTQARITRDEFLTAYDKS